MARIIHLYRYPIKGLSAEPLDAVMLRAGEGVPMDRIYALARPGTVFDEADPRPLPKSHFLMLAKDEALAQVTSRYEAPRAAGHWPAATPRTQASGDAEEPRSRRLWPGGTLVLECSGRTLTADLARPRDRTAVEEFFAALLVDTLGGERPRLVPGIGGHRFTDVGTGSPELMRAVSLINLASVRDLADRIGAYIHHLRFRANLYVDGLEPWVELGWAGRAIRLGGVRAEILASTPRCAATTVNPHTGVRDISIPRELRARYGHVNCGVYLGIRSDGTIRGGDPVILENAP